MPAQRKDGDHPSGKVRDTSSAKAHIVKVPGHVRHEDVQGNIVVQIAVSNLFQVFCRVCQVEKKKEQRA